MAPQGDAYNVDWIVSTGSNVHVANHRDWFTSYVEFPTYMTSYYWTGTGTAQVLGVGTVILKMHAPPTSRTGPAKDYQITLRNVLYVPSYETNVVGHGITDDYSYGIASESTPITNKSGRVVGYIAKARMWRLWFEGQSEKQSSLATDKVYMINATWPEEECARFEAPSVDASGNRNVSSGDQSDAPPYTAAEKHFLNITYRGEYHYLHMYLLSINKEEDREEGRRFLRAIMLDHDPGDEDDEDDEDDVGDEAVSGDDRDSFLAEIERDPASHVADYHFSVAQLDWIKKHHGHSGNILLSCGLKPWDDEDCKEGVQVVEQMMASRE